METIKATIIWLKSDSANRDGKPYYSEALKKNYSRVSIKTKEHGEKYLSMNDVYGKCKDLKVGDTVDIIVTQNGNFTNFDFPKKTKNESKPFANDDQVLHQIEVLKTKISRLSALVERLYEKSFGEQIDGYPIEDIKAEDITFDQK